MSQKAQNNVVELVTFTYEALVKEIKGAGHYSLSKKYGEVTGNKKYPNTALNKLRIKYNKAPQSLYSAQIFVVNGQTGEIEPVLSWKEKETPALPRPSSSYTPPKTTYEWETKYGIYSVGAWAEGARKNFPRLNLQETDT